nr:hypothetical transcript [Hymenolepis microstoma]
MLSTENLANITGEKRSCASLKNFVNMMPVMRFKENGFHMITPSKLPKSLSAVGSKNDVSEVARWRSVVAEEKAKNQNVAT